MRGDVNSYASIVHSFSFWIEKVSSTVYIKKRMYPRYDIDIIQFQDRYGFVSSCYLDMDRSRALYLGFLRLLYLYIYGSVY